MANETSEFLEALYEQHAKEGESPTETAQRISKNLRGVSRRELLGGAGAVGVGSLLGFGGKEMVGTASADASTTDSDGNVGTPSDPVDGFFDGLNIYDGANNQIGSLDENGLDIPVVSTEEVSNIGILHSDEQDLQTLVNSYDCVLVAPGTYTDQAFPIDLPDFTTIWGFDTAFRAPAGEMSNTVFDAGGDLAFVGGPRDYCYGIVLHGFTVRGTIRLTGNVENREHLIQNVACVEADSSLDSGRGLEINGAGVMYCVRNLFTSHCDGYGVHSEGDGQALWDRVHAFANGGTVDGGQMYFSSKNIGGGEGTYRRLVAGNPPAGVDGLHLDALHNPTIIAPQIEGSNDGDKGIAWMTASGDSLGFSILGGRIFTWSDHGIHFNSDQAGNSIGPGYIGGGLKIDANGSDDLHFQNLNVKYIHVGPVQGPDRVGRPSATNNGNVITTDMANGIHIDAGSRDLSTVTGTYLNEVRWNDGASGPAGPAWWDPSAGEWTSFIDGTTI